MEHKTNVEELESIGELGNIRERIGAKDGNDASRDDEINSMLPEDIARAWSGWPIEDEEASSIISLYEKFKDTFE